MANLVFIMKPEMSLFRKPLFVLILLASVTGLWGQGEISKEGSLFDGKTLASQYCILCHELPEPDLLSKKSWEFALTYMGFYLGIVDYGYLEGSSERTMDSIRSREEFTRTANKVPDEAMLSDVQWKALRSYYVSNAPEQAIAQDSKAAILEDLESFSVRPTQYRMDRAITSMARIDEENGLLYVHDSGVQRLTILDRKLSFFDSHDAPGVALVDSQMDGDEVYLLSIGDLRLAISIETELMSFSFRTSASTRVIFQSIDESRIQEFSTPSRKSSPISQESSKAKPMISMVMVCWISSF